jgi:hypothetical protein
MTVCMITPQSSHRSAHAAKPRQRDLGADHTPYRVSGLVQYEQAGLISF